jgi:phosphonate metabolism protein (transferase hexapeptide repeat family)
LKPARPPDEPQRHSPRASRSGEPRIHPSASLRESELGRFTEIGERVTFLESSLGDYSYIERHCEVIYARIGKFTCIASQTCINALNHPIGRVSQHKFTYRPNEYFLGAKLDSEFREARKAAAVVIGHDVWIGHGVTVLPGIAIGDGAVIAAGAVVTSDVEPYAIMAGTPARFLRWRFPADIAGRLRALAWWDWDHDRLAGAVDDMRLLPPLAFLEKYEEARGP